MNAITPIAPIDEAKAEFAERAGEEHLKRLRSQLSTKGLSSGTLIAINVLNGDYVLGATDLELIDAFRRRFGPDAIGWIADLEY